MRKITWLTESLRLCIWRLKGWRECYNSLLTQTPKNWKLMQSLLVIVLSLHSPFSTCFFVTQAIHPHLLGNCSRVLSSGELNPREVSGHGRLDWSDLHRKKSSVVARWLILSGYWLLLTVCTKCSNTPNREIYPTFRYRWESTIKEKRTQRKWMKTS